MSRLPDAIGTIRAAAGIVRRLVLMASLALGACATPPPSPDADLAAARAAVLQAEPVAHGYAEAELRIAQGKLERAEQAMARDDRREARRLAEEAEVDARYAWALARNERARAGR
jgi:hypothetical protein